MNGRLHRRRFAPPRNPGEGSRGNDMKFVFDD
jgi:hypothetical protein